MGMHPALEEAIFGTQTGGFAPVEAADGLHLFKVAEERYACSEFPEPLYMKHYVIYS